jgi:Zn-dependent protease
LFHPSPSKKLLICSIFSIFLLFALKTSFFFFNLLPLPPLSPRFLCSSVFRSHSKIIIIFFFIICYHHHHSQ